MTKLTPTIQGDDSDASQQLIFCTWANPGQNASSEFDFRSMLALLQADGCKGVNVETGDTITIPTTSMLRAVACTTLLDDDFQEDPTTLDLEGRVAQLAGKESALLVLSGTMGNQLSIRALLQAPPHGILCDSRSHIMNFEAGGVASLCGAMTIAVRPSNGKYLTLEDIRKHAVVDEVDHCSCPTKLISLENTLAGTVMPLAECQRIAAWARPHGISMHLDGARLWEAIAAGKGTLDEYCKCFDTISLCFSKGLGAPIGSIIVSSRPIRERARWLRKSIGGGTRQAGVISAAARQALTDTFLSGKLEATHEKARRIAGTWKALGGRLKYPTETNMVWLDLDAAGISSSEFRRLGKEAGLKFMMGGRLVVHYQISENAVQRLEGFFKSIISAPATSV